ncbi:MAG: YraN family protein [Spirochaetales bacterium]|nr:YraN family protein [Spirochaetales bacterium]
MISTRHKGDIGEKKALDFLVSRNFKILQRNFRSPAGEIDLIARKDDTLHFIEVKAWNAYGVENLEYGIDARKRRKIINTARYFINSNPEPGNGSFHFDVIYVSKENECVYINNAFSEG